MSDASNSTQVAVIGGGPGGYAAAFRAADLGLKTTLIDPEINPGGVCVYRGCIPSKALLEAAHWGIEFAEPKIDPAKLRAWKDSVVKKLTGGLGLLSKQRSVNYIQGQAAFLNPRTLSIKRTQGGEQQLAFELAIIATGSRPATVPGLDLKGPPVMDSTSALDVADVPKSLLVIGGGYIGLELGTVYAALGTEVSVVEMLDGLLPGADRDLVSPLAKRVERIFHSIMLSTKVVEMKEEGGRIRVRFEGAQAPADAQVYDKVLVAVGRKPNSRIPGLDKTKVETDARGFIKVNLERRTSEPSIYAIGDVAGEPMLAHKATHEGLTAAEAIAGHKVAFEPRAFSFNVLTATEIAWCGLTEEQAKRENRPIKVARFPWAASGRATTLDRNEGVTKLVIDPGSERVLGVGITGVGAGEMIAEGVLAVEMAALASDLELTIHPHPTLSETVMGAAEIFYGRATDFYRPVKAAGSGTRS